MTLSQSLTDAELIAEARRSFVCEQGYATWDDLNDLIKRLADRLEERAAPIPMVLHCPACGLQHIDAPDTIHCVNPSRDAAETIGSRWTNPPHRSHLCQGCGHIWRPADVETIGVEAVQTKGKADSPIASPSSPPSSDWVLVPRRQLSVWIDLMYDSRNVSIVYGEIKALFASPPLPSVGTVTREKIWEILLRLVSQASNGPYMPAVKSAEASLLALLNPNPQSPKVTK